MLPNAKDFQYVCCLLGYTPLHVACEKGHVKVVEMLLKHGADAEAKEIVSTVPPSFPLDPPYDGTPVPHDDDDDAAVPFGQTPLHRACFNGHDKVVEMLLKHGVDAEAQNYVSTVPPSSPLYPPMMDGDTPLHVACRYGHVKVVEMLLKHGVDTKAKDNDGKTPLDLGRQCGHGNKLEPVFAAHEARLSQPPAPLAPPTLAPPRAWLPPLPTTPTLEVSLLPDLVFPMHLLPQSPRPHPT
ncbi:uncharacterized protein MONBRDRAFT_30538 [Monosiga brevicollis MX1]|uniref:Uncharacterized protein n=1 Tax=Monosiga brevicollis TaxID=81824 RepID=A9VE89_MONBE|nr:uncharacterized protein MONBRDRAFT_30538 [Monosiga brevicollis MX1]EDQ84152.1 predicted protein [Monosiga brevicollis MX1]|eukprot:XP_001751036.1 hypothetical protein [Monosiga brevicollis MX1]